MTGVGCAELGAGTYFSGMRAGATCAGIDEQKTENLRNGVFLFYKPSQEGMKQSNNQSRRLVSPGNPKPVIPEADAVFCSERRMPSAGLWKPVLFYQSIKYFSKNIEGKAIAAWSSCFNPKQSYSGGDFSCSVQMDS